MSSASFSKVPHGNDAILRLIAGFKLVKAASLLAVTFGAFELVHPSKAQVAREWLYVLQPSHHYLSHALAKILSVKPHTLELVGVATGMYAALFLVEGYGLWRERLWAEYLTTGITLSFIPLEVYELVEKQSVAKIGVIVVNIAIVMYLVLRLRRDHRWPFRR